MTETPAAASGSGEYALSQSLDSVDGQGIRACCVLPKDNDEEFYRLVTGSQNGRLVEYSIPSGRMQVIPYQHDHAITALLSATAAVIYVSGCKDAKIRLFDGNTHELIGAPLEGHDKPVTSLAWADHDYLISGSWDGTARVWDLTRRVVLAVLDHAGENAICVAGLDRLSNSLNVLTGSAGRAEHNVVRHQAVRVWSIDVTTGQATCQATAANDHDGPIRDVCQVNSSTVASCSNDGTIQLRSLEHGAQPISRIYWDTDEPPMLLSLATLNSTPDKTTLVTGAEDGQVVLFSADPTTLHEPQRQRLPHASCIWQVQPLRYENDFATCADDGVVRIFSQNPDRWAPEAERAAFAQLAQERRAGAPISEADLAKLPLWQDRARHVGKSEGQVQLFRKEGGAIAAQWSAVSGTWIEVGQVLGGRPASGGGGVVNGVAYDHVFPIEVDQTSGAVARLQIGYNTGENPFVAAQRFIDDHVLPQHHLTEIADYITKQAGTPALSMDNAKPPATTGLPLASYQHFPITSYLAFELPDKNATSMLEKMTKKMLESQKLSEQQGVHLQSLVATLGATNRYHATKIQDEELAVIPTLVDLLPRSEVFPALDLARFVVLHPDAAAQGRATYWQHVIKQTLDILAQENGTTHANPMLSLRLFANALRAGPGARAGVWSRLPDVLGAVTRFCTVPDHRQVRLALATVLYNVAHAIAQQPAQNGNGSHHASLLVPTCHAVLTTAGPAKYEAEAVVRTLLALGTVVMCSTAAKETAKSLHLGAMVEPVSHDHGDVAKAVGKEVYALLQ
jgi:phospholipase A-2-activating protein